ncbi:hypothetical protein A11A3_00545 [Alcanivorax hongdengensis A-11-3]|uniref:DUF11 domain-containing protein n=2 Tax=Alcanivorax hongdengensis TaxID=519051 RepID=L0WIG6_9GAMM|nr:hypothetical protein A11A3_00545 [Alcanivorax hongdengensis A-11-3]
MLLMLTIMKPALAAAPLAGSWIKNQASATYRSCLDDSCAAVSETVEVSSNLVQTLVQSVPALTLVNSQQKPGLPGSLVYFPHQLTNTGNNSDYYQLCISNVSSSIETWKVFSDLDSDGQPDGNNVLFDSSDGDGCWDASSPARGPGETYAIVIEAGIAQGAATGNQSLTITATSQENAGVSASNTDTVQVTQGPVIEVVKAMSRQTVRSPDGPVTVTLTYRNTSRQVAENVVLVDQLPAVSANGVSAGLSYLPASARWSVTGSTVLTDADDGNQGSGSDQVAFCAYQSGSADCQQQVRAVIARLAPGDTGSLTFQVNVDQGLDGGDRLQNQAAFSYQDSDGGLYGSPSPYTTNTVSLSISNALENAQVIANNSDTNSATGLDDSVDTGNLVVRSSLDQGGAVRFQNVIWNGGDGEDTVDIRVDASSDRNGAALASPFPAGTQWQFYKADGYSPLTDSTGDAVVDTGPIPLPDALGNCPPRFVSDGNRCGVLVVLKATLPADAQGGPFQVTVRGTSHTLPAVSNAVTDQLDSIQVAGVDLTNDRPVDGAAPGEGAGPASTPVSTLPLVAGSSGMLRLYVNNTGNRQDTFDLTYSDTNFSAGSLASGWQVVFLADGGNDDCSTTGAAMNNTGLILPGSARLVCARVSAPADGAGNATLPLYFRARSPTTAVSDIKYDQATVAPTAALMLTPDQAGQIVPGGSQVYTHHLDNTGNVTLTQIQLSGVSSGGWGLVLFMDSNGNGQWDSADASIPAGSALPVSLAAGDSLAVFAKVLAPANVAMGTVDTATLTATADSVAGTVSATAKDTTTANDSQASITKEQALDSDCDGVPDGPGTCSGDNCFVYTRFSVEPGQACVVYRLVATNVGAATLYGVTLNDRTQPYTGFLAAATDCQSPAGDCSTSVQAPADNGSGDITVNVGELVSGASATLKFGLRVH